jgi:hypothetical protein
MIVLNLKKIIIGRRKKIVSIQKWCREILLRGSAGFRRPETANIVL